MAVRLASRGSTSPLAKSSSTASQPGTNPTLRTKIPSSGIGSSEGTPYSRQKPSAVLALPCLGIARFAQLCEASVMLSHPTWHHSARYSSPAAGPGPGPPRKASSSSSSSSTGDNSEAERSSIVRSGPGASEGRAAGGNPSEAARAVWR